MGTPSGTRHPVTRGEAESILQAFGGAGRILRSRRIVNPGNPADPGVRASIRPLSDPALPFNNRHYCVEDWHVILIAEFDGGDRSFTEVDANSLLSPINFTFTLDGVELTDITRTPIHRLLDSLSLDPTFEVAYFFQQGKLFAPNELAVGQHSLSVVEATPTQEIARDSIIFFIDAAGEGVCVES